VFLMVLGTWLSFGLVTLDKLESLFGQWKMVVTGGIFEPCSSMNVNYANGTSFDHCMKSMFPSFC
jgi:hypothetical protein